MKKAAKKSPSVKAKPVKAGASKKNSIGFQPLGDRVLVKPTPQETVTSFGILIPDNAKEKPEQGVVVAVGPGRRTDKGEQAPVGVKVGDTVMFSKYGFDEVKVEGVEYYLVREESILAILG